MFNYQYVLDRYTVMGRTEDEDYIRCIGGDGECMGVATKRMLCDAHYMKAKRDGTLWQYIDNVYIDDFTPEGEDRLDALCRWILEFNYPELVEGLNNYLEGTWEAYLTPGWRGRGQVGFVPYPANGIGNSSGSAGLCVECGKHVARTRGLCVTCYTDIHNEGMINDYPTKSYVNNTKGHVYFILNHHLDRLIAIASSEYGVEIVRIS